MSDVEVTLSEYTVEITISGSDSTEIVVSDDIAAYTDAANHIADINNPHAVTKSQIGLSNVINAEQLLRSQLEQSLTPTASGSVPSSKAVADYISDVSLNMSGTDIVAAINSGSAVINGANISSQMASKTYVDNSISAATADMVTTSDIRLTNARTPIAHTHSAYDITSFDTRVSNNATIRAAFDALAAMDAIQFDHLQDASVHFTSAERAKLASIEAGATGDMNASQIVSLINNSASIINDARIASTITRDSELTAAIDAHSASPTAHHTNVNDPTALEKAALAGQGGTPSGTNRFVVNSDPRLTEPRVPLTHASSHIAGGNDIIPSATVSTAGLMSSADKIKLNSIESGATADMTASEILTALLTVDTDTSGLNAQTVKSCAVQTTITNSDSYIPTSGAVTDLFATKLSPFDLRAAGWNVVGKYNGGSSSTTTATANYVMYWPLPIGSKNVTITKLGINITAGATGNFRMGIYSDSGSVAPSALLYDYGEGSTANTGLIELSSSNTLSANTLYWVGLTYSAKPTITFYNQAYCTSIGVIDATPTMSALCWRESRPYAALPANVGTIAKHDAACQSFAYFTY
jgi:hypothetical protein